MVDTTFDKAKALVAGDRMEAYGPPVVNFQRIAGGWTVLLGTAVTPKQVAACMCWVKLARLVNGWDHQDSWVDACAYAGIGGLL